MSLGQAPPVATIQFECTMISEPPAAMLQYRRPLPLLVSLLLVGLLLYCANNLYRRLNHHTASSVIILTYMRSGSTFAGSLFEASPDVFYEFESLKGIYDSESKEMKFLEVPTRLKRDYISEVSDIIRSKLECRLTDLDMESLTHYHLKHSRDTKRYFDCIEPHRTNATKVEIYRCLHLIQKPCSASKVRVVKEIRLPIEAMDTILGASQSVKMIHLFRDPRAAIRSQMMYGNSPSPKVYPYAKKTCKDVLKDIKIREQLEMKYPGRIKLVFYEDLAKEPLRVTKELYAFAGLHFTAEVEEYVKSITSGKINTSCLLCIYKSNSVYESLKWRKGINYLTATLIDSLCGAVYKELGYLPLKSERQLRDTTQSLRKTGNRGILVLPKK
ncbi:carbohydrate sulfotransferase 5-like [Haliotis rubra]|uniref:carbohydrate sulfotransferase 5-like n=1 Tax=Haliotis rubra TaxID=36100 RepID=UPI001EE56E88|nr:carbohydrate sulfotransferase 5-like [Haliotis rubra]